MLSARAFLGVIGAFSLIGAVVGLWNPITLEDTNVEGTAVARADVSGGASGNAAVADQRNEMGRVWAIPLAIVGGALLLGAVLMRPRDPRIHQLRTTYT